jgi:hypothetical protein
MANAETYMSDGKPTDHAAVEDVSLKRDEAAIAAAEEHSLSMKDALLNNKRILWWCFFFAMSAIGWWVDLLSNKPESSTTAYCITGGLMHR